MDDKPYDATPTRFLSIMQRLFPVLLRLASSSEPVARQLFEELVMALIHWFTRSSKKCVNHFLPSQLWTLPALWNDSVLFLTI